MQQLLRFKSRISLKMLFWISVRKTHRDYAVVQETYVYFVLD